MLTLMRVSRRSWHLLKAGKLALPQVQVGRARHSPGGGRVDASKYDPGDNDLDVTWTRSDGAADDIDTTDGDTLKTDELYVGSFGSG